MTQTKKNIPTKKELAEANVFPHGLTEKQKLEADRELTSLRKQRWQNRSETDQIRDSLLQLKYQIEQVIESPLYQNSFHYGYFLASYIRLIKKKQKEFALEISIDETRLSRIIHQKEMPNEELFIRLELHSKNTIPAVSWFKLAEKWKAHYIQTNHEIRKAEQKFVLNTI